MRGYFWPVGRLALSTKPLTPLSGGFTKRQAKLGAPVCNRLTLLKVVESKPVTNQRYGPESALTRQHLVGLCLDAEPENWYGMGP